MQGRCTRVLNIFWYVIRILNYVYTGGYGIVILNFPYIKIYQPRGIFGTSQTPKMECFAKIIKSGLPLINFA